MTVRPRREFLMQSAHGRMKDYVCLGLSLLFAMGATFHALAAGGRSVLLAVALWALAVRLGRDLRLGILLTEQGFWELFYGRRPRLYRWEDVREVDVRRHEVRVVTSQGTVRADASLDAWQRLAASAGEALGHSVGDEPAGAAVQPDEVEDWLGVEPGGRLRWRLWTSRPFWVYAPVPAFVSYLHMAFQRGWQFVAPQATLFVATWAAAMLTACWLGGGVPPLAIDVSAHGLYVRTMRGRRRFGWNTIRSISEAGDWCFVGATKGGFRFHANSSSGNALRSAIHSSIVARERGHVLPRLTDVSDAAISSVPQSAAAADRGLSSVSIPDQDPTP